MNLRQLAILFALMAVLGGVGLAIHHKQSSSWGTGDAAIGTKLLSDLPINDVAHIVLRQGSNEVNLVRKDDVWCVRERGDHPANFSQIGEFLLKAHDLKSVQSEKVGPSQLPRFQLAAGQGSNSALVVEFKGSNDRPLKTLLVGKKHMGKSAGPSPAEGDEGWANGRYVRVGDSDNVALISDPLDNFGTAPEEWLSKDFIRIEKAQTIAVTFPDATNSWKLTRNAVSEAWKLADAKPTEHLDPVKVEALSNPLNAVTFTDVLPVESVTNNGSAQPIVAIDTFDQFNYTLKIGSKTNDDYLLSARVVGQVPKERTPEKEEKPADKIRLDKEFADRRQKLEEKLKNEQRSEAWAHLVPASSLESLLKKRAELLTDEKEQPKDHQGAKTSNDGLEGSPGSVMPAN